MAAETSIWPIPHATLQSSPAPSHLLCLQVLLPCSLTRMALGQHPPCSDRPRPSYCPPLAGPTIAGTPRPGHCLLRPAGPTHALHPIHLHDDVQPPENGNSSSSATSPTDSIKCQMPAATKAAVTAGTATLSDHFASPLQARQRYPSLLPSGGHT